ncbi:MAG: GNAT family N-acetyltransferase [Clostridia bacterium]|nr:GNAT family N-acetyltransferase [Clostridia bacterium]
MNFYLHNGLTIGNTEDLVRLQIPVDAGPDLFNCTIIQLPLNTQQEQSNFLERLRLNGLNYITPQYLQLLQSSPCFLGLGILYGQNLVGELIIAGQGTTAELAAMYIAPEFQRRGLGKKLLQRALVIVGSEGITEVRARIMSASQPQVRLMQSFQSELIDQTMLFPCLDV